MIGIFLETGLFPAQLFEVTLRRLRTMPLQSLFEGVHTLAVLFNGLPTKRFASAISGKVDNTQVYAKCVRRVERLRSGNVQRHREVEGATAIEQIGLPFNLVKTGLLIATHTEGHQDATLQSQKRNFTQSLEGHEPFIPPRLERAGHPERNCVIDDLCRQVEEKLLAMTPEERAQAIAILKQ